MIIRFAFVESSRVFVANAILTRGQAMLPEFARKFMVIAVRLMTSWVGSAIKPMHRQQSKNQSAHSLLLFNSIKHHMSTFILHLLEKLHAMLKCLSWKAPSTTMNCSSLRIPSTSASYVMTSQMRVLAFVAVYASRFYTRDASALRTYTVSLYYVKNAQSFLNIAATASSIQTLSVLLASCIRLHVWL